MGGMLRWMIEEAVRSDNFKIFSNNGTNHSGTENAANPSACLDY